MRNGVKKTLGGGWKLPHHQQVCCGGQSGQWERGGQQSYAPVAAVRVCRQGPGGGEDSCVTRPATSPSIRSSNDDRRQGLSGNHLVLLWGGMCRGELELAHRS